MLRNAQLLEYLLVWLERNGVFSDEERLRLHSLSAESDSECSAVELEELKGYVLKKK
jgi:hypothetical protein